MVLLDARDRPKEVDPQSPPVGDPCGIEGDGRGGLKEKEEQTETVEAAKTNPTQSQEIHPAWKKAGDVLNANDDFCRAFIAWHILVEKCKIAEAAKDAAFAELLAIKAGAAPSEGDQQKLPRKQHRPLTDEQITAAAKSRTARNKRAAAKAAAPPIEDTHQEEINSYFPPAESPPEPPAPDPTDWRSVTTQEAGIPEAICKVLADQNDPDDCLETVGDLDAFARAKKEGYRQGKDGQTELTNLRKIGQGKSDLIVKHLGEFWAENPKMAAAYVAEFPPPAEGGKPVQ